MTIEYNPNFRLNFTKIWNFIAKDSINRANTFKKQLKSKITDIPYMPYKFRRSLYYNDKNIRDLIHKGYTIPYLIDNKDQKIIILDIFKWIEK